MRIEGQKYDIANIPTKYAGVTFKSRMESRWAAFFDLLKWPWEYEPFQMNGWEPDFILQFSRKPVLVECKPFTEDQWKEVIPTFTQKWDNDAYDVLFTGSTLNITEKVWGCDTLGLVNQQLAGFAPAPLFYCLGCKRPSFTHADGGWQCYVNGCYDGNALIDTERLNFKNTWNEAVAVIAESLKSEKHVR